MLNESQVKHTLSNLSDWRIQSSYLLLDDDVDIQLLVDDARWDFAKHFLKRYILFKCWLEVHFQKGFPDLKGRKVKGLQGTILFKRLNQSDETCFVRQVFVLCNIQKFQAFVEG